MSKWIGYAVSVNCGEPLGCYQGTILDADGTTITLTKAFRNGFPYPKSQVTLNAADIKDLKIIEARPEPAEQTHSTVALSKTNKKATRATVCENLQANPSSSVAGSQQSQSNVGSSNNKCSATRSGPTPVRSKPIDIQSQRPGKNNNHTGPAFTHRDSTNSGSYGPTGSTPKARGGGAGVDKARRRNEACFGELAEPGLQADFDFEGNLALFDKRALWEQMNSQKPDLVRQTDEAGKFRHDENILGGGPATSAGTACRRAIRVPEHLRAALDYVSDEGVVVPAAGARLRRALWDALARHGLLPTARALLARGAADVCLRLVGGGRRLEPRNAHQAPTVVVLAAAHCVGAAALAAARLLVDHNVRVAYWLLAPPPADHPVSLEAAALGLCGAAAAAAARLELLPRPDAVLFALHDVAHSEECTDARVAAAVEWSRSMRAAVVALEPRAGASTGALRCRAAVVCGLPPALPAHFGRVYLCAAGVPARLFADLRVHYRPPFGAEPLLALHPADD